MLDKAIENVETALEVLEHAAEVTEKLAANVASSLPEDGSLHKVAEEIEYIAEVVDKDAQKVEVIIKKVREDLFLFLLVDYFCLHVKIINKYLCEHNRNYLYFLKHV
jgi:hypothetical protein